MFTAVKRAAAPERRGQPVLVGVVPAEPSVTLVTVFFPFTRAIVIVSSPPGRVKVHVFGRRIGTHLGAAVKGEPGSLAWLKREDLGDGRGRGDLRHCRTVPQACHAWYRSFEIRAGGGPLGFVLELLLRVSKYTPAPMMTTTTTPTTIRIGTRLLFFARADGAGVSGV